MSASSGVAPARRMALVEAKKLKGVVTTDWPEPGSPRTGPGPWGGEPISAGGQRQPKGVCARGAADGVGHAQPLRCGFFKGGDGLAENELLRGQDLTESVQKFLMEGLILAFEVQHGHRLGGGGGAGRRIRLGFHTYMLAAAWLPRSQKQDRRSLNYSLR